MAKIDDEIIGKFKGSLRGGFTSLVMPVTMTPAKYGMG